MWRMVTKMNVSFNAGYSYNMVNPVFNSKGSNALSPKEAFADKEIGDYSYSFQGYSEFHPAYECEPGELYTGYATAGAVGDDTFLPANFYYPSDYNEDDPVIIARLYPWDGSDAAVKEIHLKDVDLSSADYYETFAYGIYLEKKGVHNGLDDMLAAYDLASDRTIGGTSFETVDVIGSIINLMNEGYNNGRIEQYLSYKKLMDIIDNLFKD